MEILLFNKHKCSFSDVRDEKVSELGTGFEKQAGNIDGEHQICMNVLVKVQLRLTMSFFKVGFNDLYRCVW